MNIIKSSAAYIDLEHPYKKIELCGRTCYKSEDNISEGSAVKFVGNMIKSKHYAMLEHAHIYIVTNTEVAKFMAKYKYLNVSYSDETYFAFVSGSFRAFLEIFDTYKKTLGEPILDEIFYLLSDIYPEVFNINDTNIESRNKYDITILLNTKAFIDTVDNLVKDKARNEQIKIKHLVHTIMFICDRGVSHEFVRHRPASFAQESTRYCVAGTTELKFKNAHCKYTIEELYNNIINSKNAAWKRMLIRQYNEETGELQYVHIKNIFKNGIKTCLKFTTKLGYELICTTDHEILTNNGYISAENFSIGDKIYVNGTDLLYKNKDWLYHQYITLNKTWDVISDEFNINVSTLKKWANKLGIPKKPKSYFNVGRTPWNKGIQCEAQINALRKYHHCGRRKDKILKEDTSEYQKYCKDSCEICGSTEELDVHHIDENRKNNYPINLITLCKSCHARVHSKNLEVAYEDTIISIENIGEQTVYDLEVDSIYHNYIANGVVVHNCNYSKDKYGNEITVIEPYFFTEDSTKYALWKRACEKMERIYFDLLASGATAQEARSVLPNSLKTQLIITATEEEWQHIVNLRYHGTTGKPHPQMVEVMSHAYNILTHNSKGRIN